jgi:hypothetical protein
MRPDLWVSCTARYTVPSYAQTHGDLVPLRSLQATCVLQVNGLLP